MAQALQNNTSDRLLRDYGVNVHEAMAWSNGVGAVAVLFVTLWTGELWRALAYFGNTGVGSALLLLRSLLFYVGALLYTILIRCECECECPLPSTH